MDHKAFMQEALLEAHSASEKGEVPVGAVVVIKDTIIARAHNLVESLRDATAHAEILALREASRVLGDWRLKDASLFVTLEPCPMCIGACILSRVDSLYFGCYDERLGAVGSKFDLSNAVGLPHEPKVYPEILAGKCRTLLTEFFRQRRK